MKIRKLPDIESKIKLRQAQELAQRPLSLQEVATIGAENNPVRRAASALRNDSIIPITKPLRVYPGTPALVEPINQAMLTTGEDLRVLADSTTILEDDLVEIYNQVRTRETDLIGQIKSIRNKIVTISLYKDGLTNNKYIVYSFDDASDLQEGSLTVNEEEGHLTLPVVSSKVIPVNKVTYSGNGRPGNSVDRTRGSHNNVQTIVDSDAQTWFEYEKVSNSPGTALSLTLKLELETPVVINKITIAPVNFGTARWASIEDIQIAQGELIESIKDEILSGTAQESLKLSPAASKFAGVGTYTFYPRQASAVYVKLLQTESYPILNGRFFRTAIGVKEIELQQLQFNKEGAFTLSTKGFLNPVLGIGLKKIVSLGNQLDYSLSMEARVNEDIEWTPVQFLTDSESVQEVIVDKSISSVQLRGKLSRADRVSPREDSRIKNVIRTQLKEVAGGEVELDSSPKTFLEVVETRLGAVGFTAPPFFLGRAAGLSEVTQTFNCPIEIDPLRAYVEVNGKRWNFVSSLGDENYEGVLYFPNRTSGQIEFGNGVVGKLPPAGAEIYLRIRPEEQTVFTETSEGFSGELDFQSDKIKGLTRIYFRDFDEREGESRVGPGGRFFTINETHQSITITRLEVNGEELDPEDEIPFQNGSNEFANLDVEDGPYFSVDRDRNKVYLSVTLGDNAEDAIVQYKYQLRQLLPQGSWNYSDTENAVIINSPLFKVRSNEKTISAQVSQRVLKLVGNAWLGEDYTLIKKSIIPIDLNGIVGITRTLENELTFIDGATEFNQILLPELSLLGFYSVDYKNSRIHLPPQDDIDEADRGFLPGKILFQYVGAEIEYGVGRKLLKDSDFELRGSRVSINPSYLRKIQESGRSPRFHVRYDIDQTVVPRGVDVTPHFSPLIKDIVVVGSGIDSRLGTIKNV